MRAPGTGLAEDRTDLTHLSAAIGKDKLNANAVSTCATFGLKRSRAQADLSGVPGRPVGVRILRPPPAPDPGGRHWAVVGGIRDLERERLRRSLPLVEACNKLHYTTSLCSSREHMRYFLVGSAFVRWPTFPGFPGGRSGCAFCDPRRAHPAPRTAPAKEQWKVPPHEAHRRPCRWRSRGSWPPRGQSHRCAGRAHVGASSPLRSRGRSPGTNLGRIRSRMPTTERSAAARPVFRTQAASRVWSWARA